MKPLFALLTAAYPAIVYVSMTRNLPSLAVIVLATTVSLRLLSIFARRDAPLSLRLIIPLFVGCAAYGLCAVVPSSPLFYPVLVNSVLLSVFALSLRQRSSIVEIFATSMRGPLPPEGVRYCRNVTKVWVVFLAINALVSLDSTFRPLEWWSLYNGLISYCLVGALFASEYVVRRQFMKRAGIAAAIILSFGPCLSAHSQALSVEQVRQHLKPPAPFRTAFTEQRFIAVLTAPLESRGEMECVPGKGLIWKTTDPIAKTSIITPDGLTLIEEGQKPRSISDGANISEALLSLMSGDIERASQTFTITASGTPSDWILTLTPTDSLVAELLEKIVVRGREQPESIDVLHANKDKIVTRFSHPLPLSPSELAKAQATLNEAL